MRRTHIMHTRDNRRPHFWAQRDHNDKRPCLRWEYVDGIYWMLVDEKRVAEVRPLDDYGLSEWGTPTYQRHDAILRAGSDAGTRRPFYDLGAAKAWCEAKFAKESP